MDVIFIFFLIPLLCLSTYLVVSLSGDRAIEIFTIIWFLTPNWFQPLDQLGMLPPFRLIELFAALGLLNASLFIMKNNELKFEKKSQSLYVLPLGVFMCLGLLVNFLFSVTTWQFGNMAHPMELGEFIGLQIDLCAACLFIYCSGHVVRSSQQIDRLLKLILALTFVMGVEFIGHLILPGTLFSISINEKQVFRSVFLNDSLLVSVFFGVSCLIAINLFLSRKRKLYLLLFLLFSFLSFAMLKRTAFFGMILCSAYIVTQYSPRARGAFLGMLLVGCVAISMLFLLQKETVFVAPVSPQERRLVNLFSDDSLRARIGIMVASAQLSFSQFPAGTGFGFSDRIEPEYSTFKYKFSDKIMQANYDRVLNFASSNSHNIFMETIVSFGLFGFLIIARLLTFIFAVFVKHPSAKCAGTSILAKALVVFFLLFYSTNAKPFVYILLALPFCATLVSQNANRLSKNTKNLYI